MGTNTQLRSSSHSRVKFSKGAFSKDQVHSSAPDQSSSSSCGSSTSEHSCWLSKLSSGSVARSEVLQSISGSPCFNVPSTPGSFTKGTLLLGPPRSVPPTSPAIQPPGSASVQKGSATGRFLSSCTRGCGPIGIACGPLDSLTGMIKRHEGLNDTKGNLR